MKVLVLLSGFILLFINSLNFDNFDKVIEQAKNKQVKNKLEEFRKGGIEKETFDYDIEAVISYAQSFLGTPHQMGGESSKGIDCSGLVKVSHEKFGVILPHSSHEQARYGKVIPTLDELKRGDLVFYYNSYNSVNFITHTGIYLGDGTFIHVSSKRGVIISDVADKYYWGERFLFGTRLKK